LHEKRLQNVTAPPPPPFFLLLAESRRPEPRSSFLLIRSGRKSILDRTRPFFFPYENKWGDRSSFVPLRLRGQDCVTNTFFSSAKHKKSLFSLLNFFFSFSPLRRRPFFHEDQHEPLFSPFTFFPPVNKRQRRRHNRLPSSILVYTAWVSLFFSPFPSLPAP